VGSRYAGYHADVKAGLRVALDVCRQLYLAHHDQLRSRVTRIRGACHAGRFHQLSPMPCAEKPRCPWCWKDDIYKRYHDEVWGVPEHDDRKLFAKLILDGAQAGLSWYTILIRSEGYRKAYHDWDMEQIARYGPEDVERLMNDPGIIRNRA